MTRSNQRLRTNVGSDLAESTKVQEKEVTLDAPEHKAGTCSNPTTIKFGAQRASGVPIASASRCGVMVDLAGWLTLGTESGHSKSEIQIQVPLVQGRPRVGRGRISCVGLRSLHRFLQDTFRRCASRCKLIARLEEANSVHGESCSALLTSA
jgi:hypothetical protein